MNAMPGTLQVPDESGNTVELSLAAAGQQAQVLQELLLHQLVRCAIAELQGAPNSDWFAQTAGESAQSVLTNYKQLKQRHLLALLAALLRCNMLARLYPQEAAEAAGDAARKHKKQRTDGSNGSSSGSGSSRHDKPYVFIARPVAAQAAARSSAAAGASADNAPAAGTSAAASLALPGMVREQPAMQLQLTVWQEGQHSRFYVVSCTLMQSNLLAAKLGKEDGEYELCLHCQQQDTDEELTCCDGLHCVTAMHASHLPKAEQKAAKAAKTWLCRTCLDRGRSPSNPNHLKESAVSRLPVS